MATSDPCFKIILCGEYGVGKSSLFRRFLDNSFTEHSGQRSTIGLDHLAKKFNVDGKTIKLELWDTAGIERFATLSASYFQSASAAILCYAINSRDSFNMISQHLLEIIMHSDTAKIFLCGNKKDLVHDEDEEVTPQDVENFKLQCDRVLSGTYRVSCKTGEDVWDMFHDIASIVSRGAQLRFDPSKVKPQRQMQPQEKQSCCNR